jgi:hypothetical protein
MLLLSFTIALQSSRARRRTQFHWERQVEHEELLCFLPQLASRDAAECESDTSSCNERAWRSAVQADGCEKYGNTSSDDGVLETSITSTITDERHDV